MRGTQGIINRLLIDKNELSPIGDNTLLRTIEVIFDEQWKELARQYQFQELPVITIPNFGRFEVRNSKLRKYIRDSVKKIRKLRKRLARLKEENKDYDEASSMTSLMIEDLILKVRASWKQLEAVRHHWIERNKVHQWKKSHKSNISLEIDEN